MTLFAGYILGDIYTLLDPVGRTAIASLHDGVGIYSLPLDILAFVVCSLFSRSFLPDISSRRTSQKIPQTKEFEQKRNLGAYPPDKTRLFYQCWGELSEIARVTKTLSGTLGTWIKAIPTPGKMSPI